MQDQAAVNKKDACGHAIITTGRKYIEKAVVFNIFSMSKAICAIAGKLQPVKGSVFT